MSASKPIAEPIDGLKLFRVELTQTIYVLAEDEWVAERAAPRHVRDDMGEPVATAVEVTSASGIHEELLKSLPHWDREGDSPVVRECIKIIAARESSLP